MPAMIENMFSVSETPWHGLGEILDAPPTIEEGIKLAGLDWDVSLLPLVTKTGIDAPANAVCRQVGDQTKVLGVVGPRYQPLQNRDAFSWFNPFIETGEVALETAGSLDEGKRIWVMAKINRDPSEIVKGDEVLKYLMLSNSHDGTLAIRVGYTPIRIVCANTLAMAHGSNASKLVRVRHTKSSKMALEKLHEVMNNIDAEFEATADQFRFLASRMFNQADVRKYVKAVLGNEKVAEEDLSTRTKNTINNIVDLIDHEYQKTALGSWWAAYNSVNQYLNYDASRNANNRMGSLWFGANGKTNDRALELALEYANAA
jgi:phage/plasmid-like protein (TIGR03299 family)